MGKLVEIRSRISGVTMGPNGAERQAALIEMQGLPGGGMDVPLRLVPEWDNPYDPDAIKIEAVLPGNRVVQLGYVKNSTTLCDFCGWEHDRFPANYRGQPACKRCGHNDHLRRDGVATRISTELRADPTLRVVGRILEVTGGIGDKKNLGCNISLTPLHVENEPNNPYRKLRLNTESE